jgi:CobW/HypB/UreG, nucleotide-binding domain
MQPHSRKPTRLAALMPPFQTCARFAADADCVLRFTGAGITSSVRIHPSTSLPKAFISSGIGGTAATAICPALIDLGEAALFDLGEAARVVVASVAEGDDKPEKYPYMFETANLVVLNKCDLLPYVPFDCDRFEQILHQVNPATPVLRVSALRGDNLDTWYDWLPRGICRGRRSSISLLKNGDRPCPKC